MKRELSRRGVLALAGLAGLTACAPAQTRYQPSGEGIIDVVVPYSSGGGTDTWARFITAELASRQEGVDRYQIDNVPGGESITGTNAYVSADVTDGRQLLVSSATTYFQNMLGHHTAQFDFAEMEPLVFNGTGAVLWTGESAGVRDVYDLLERAERVKYGGMSASGLDAVALLALETLGIKVDGVFGFEGRGPTRLAVQRNETDLDFQTTATYLSQVQPLVDDGRAFPLMSVGILEGDRVVRDPALSDVPTVDELLEEINPQGREGIAHQAYQSFVTPGFFFQKGLWSNAGTETAVIDAYDDLVAEMNSDEEFLEESKSALGGYDLISGKDVRGEFRTALELDPEVLEFTRAFLTDEHGAVLD